MGNRNNNNKYNYHRRFQVGAGIEMGRQNKVGEAACVKCQRWGSGAWQCNKPTPATEEHAGGWGVRKGNRQAQVPVPAIKGRQAWWEAEAWSLVIGGREGNSIPPTSTAVSVPSSCPPSCPLSPARPGHRHAMCLSPSSIRGHVAASARSPELPPCFIFQRHVCCASFSPSTSNQVS